MKWKGYSAKETTWEPEENVLEKGMMRAVLKQPAFGEKARPKPPAARQPAEPTEVAAAAAEPTRARSARASAHAASEAACRANQADAESEVEEESEPGESEPEESAQQLPRAVPGAGVGKKQKAAPSRGQVKRGAKPAAKTQAAKRHKARGQPKAATSAQQPQQELDSSDEEGAHK